MKRIKVIAISVLILIPVTLFCIIKFSKEERQARQVRRNAHLINTGMSTQQIAQLIGRPHGRIQESHLRDTTILIYYWGLGSSSNMEVFVKNDTAVLVHPGE